MGLGVTMRLSFFLEFYRSVASRGEEKEEEEGGEQKREEGEGGGRGGGREV